MAIAHFSPDILLFIGVAGGLKADVNLGDVIASTKVYGYHSGKSADEFHTRPELAFTAYPLEQQARAAIRQDIWRQRIRAVTVTGQKGRSPTARIGAIAAGEHLVSGENSQTFAFLRERYSDALAVEMEGYGALHAASRLGTPAMVVRGISDNVTNKSDCDGKGWQPIAAANASAFAFEVLAHLDISPFGRPRVTGTNFPPLGPVIDQGPSEASTYPTQVLEDELPGRDLNSRQASGDLDRATELTAVGLVARFDTASSGLLRCDTSVAAGRWIKHLSLQISFAELAMNNQR